MDTKTFYQIYDMIMAHWPESIDVKDKTFFTTGGVRVPNLIAMYDEVSTAVEDGLPEYTEETEEYIEWAGHIDWEISVLLHLAAKTSDVIYPHQLNRKDVLASCLKNEYFIDDWAE